MSDLTLNLSGETLEQLADLIADRLAERQNTPAGWLDVKGAAEYLACPTSRIYDLVSQGRLKPARDGRNLRFRPEWLDAALDINNA